MVVGGLVSSVSGGVISDKLSIKDSMGLANVCIYGSVLGMPMFILSVLIIKNFWLSMFFYALKTLFSENWWSTSLTMVQNTVPSNKFGMMLTSSQLFGRLSCSASTIFLAYLVNVFNCYQNPILFSQIIAIFGFLSYSASIISFYIAGRHYKAKVEKKDFALFDNIYAK